MSARLARRGRLAALSLSLALVAAASPPGPSIRLADDGAFEVAGLDRPTLDRVAEGTIPPDLLEVRVVGAAATMLGRIRPAGEVLRFEPRYPIRPGVRYRATFRPGRLPGGDPMAAPVESDLGLADPTSGEPARVVAVYPSAEILPENLLRFYLHFSSPMARGGSYRRLRLLDESGRPVASPFLELEEELWDPAGIRLTVLIDPGRIKSGLVPRAEMGPVLERGRNYTLVIDGDWPDARGRPLAGSFAKPFRAGPAADDPIDPRSWRIEPPGSGGRGPLVVVFAGPLDHALLARMVRVEGSGGKSVAGRSEVGDRETRWSFVPEDPWAPGDYQIVIDADLEDPAGNAVGRPFEVDVFDRIERRVEPRFVRVPFRVE